jgi:hypothetical protein
MFYFNFLLMFFFFFFNFIFKILFMVTLSVVGLLYFILFYYEKTTFLKLKWFLIR